MTGQSRQFDSPTATSDPVAGRRFFVLSMLYLIVLLSLGIAYVAWSAVRQVIPETRRIPLGDHQRWRIFLTNQLRGIWAADLFVVQTVSYRILYVFFW